MANVLVIRDEGTVNSRRKRKVSLPCAKWI